MMLSANLIKFRSGSEIPNKRQGIARSLKGFWIFLCLACAIPIFIGCRAINKPKIRNATPLAALEKAPSGHLVLVTDEYGKIPNARGGLPDSRLSLLARDAEATRNRIYEEHSSGEAPQSLTSTSAAGATTIDQ